MVMGAIDPTKIVEVEVLRGKTDAERPRVEVVDEPLCPASEVRRAVIAGAITSGLFGAIVGMAFGYVLGLRDGGKSDAVLDVQPADGEAAPARRDRVDARRDVHGDDRRRRDGGGAPATRDGDGVPPARRDADRTAPVAEARGAGVADEPGNLLHRRQGSRRRRAHAEDAGDA
ncbi:hypothetical protein [Nannocystis pusilla]|uniref:hypothetical protein n=1 Tax=Nannocystis pusilla TaxID=889268 RepID=UPI003B7831CA